MSALEALDGLAALPDNWDGEGAVAPNAAARDAAREVLRALIDRGVTTLDVDADVTGGVAVTLYGNAAGRSVWFSCDNTGEIVVIYSANTGALPHGERLGGGSMERALAWVS